MAQRLQPLWETGAVTLWMPQTIADQLPQHDHLRGYEGSLRSHLAQLWPDYQGFIFGYATGATVRLIAPLLQDKATDPAIVVLEGTGKFVISLCGGHQGGADRLTWAIAHQLGATPVLTGGANELALPGIDVLGVPFGWQKGSGDWTGVSAAAARLEPVEVFQEAGSTLWQQRLPDSHPFRFGASEVDAQESTAIAARLWISPIQRKFAPESDYPKADYPKAQWHPRVLWVGIGCERGSSRRLIEAAVEQACRSQHLAMGAIAGIATLDLKADEVGLLEWCGDRQLPLRCATAEVLRSIPVPNPSAVVEAEVGTPSVSEAAAIWVAQQMSSDPVELRVSKQIVRLPDEPGAVTVAIAQADREYTGRDGQLWLVGTGPGQLSQITPAAQAAIAQADVIVGYQLYVDLISALLRPGQIVEALPITQERQRAERAIELAQWGLTVAVISSGDCGIYGMAGLVLEQLQVQNWDGKTPAVQVFPGISALQSAASRVGAPLMHDFCAISLSDLLTPWPVIEKRLIAAAQADFVVALYNPRSQTRTEQIAIAQKIFLQHRSPETPVATVRSAYRPDEHITQTTLAQLLEAPIDMLTTVLIGNQSTRFHQNWMITPRGYLGGVGSRE